MLRYLIPLFASVCLFSANSPSIGLIRSPGEFRIDGSVVSSNGAIFEGAVVETSAALSVIQLGNAEMTVAPESRVRVYQDHIVLEKGSGSVKDSAHRLIEAATMRIVPTTRESVVQIDINSPAQITVSARGGGAEVSNSAGILTARLSSGMALAFSPQAAADSAVKLTGTIESHGSSFFLTDKTTSLIVQLVESVDVSKNLGKRVEITGASVPGATLVGGASMLVRVATINPITDKKTAGAIAAGTGGAAGGAAAGTAAGAGASGAAVAGISAVTVGAIVGGAAVAASVGGLAAAGTFSSAGSTSHP